MGAQQRNMLQKLAISAVVLLAFSHHFTDATCQLAQSYGATAVPQSGNAETIGQYNTVGDAGATCTTACGACGQAVGIVDSENGDIFPVTVMTGIAQGICPTINYGFTAAATDAVNCPGFGAAPVQTAPGVLYSSGVTGGLNSQGVFGKADGAVTCFNAAAVTGLAKICSCVTDNRNTCSFCGCADFGIPTAAPTAIPTTAPTAATSSPTTGGNAITGGSSDDSLSGGAIAGIVIGSVVGAALIIGAGVMIGSK